MWISFLLKFYSVRKIKNFPIRFSLLFITLTRNVWNLCSKYLAQVTGSDFIKMDFSSHVNALTSSSVRDFWLTNLFKHFSKGGYFVSAAEKEQNQVGVPNCLIIANTSFFFAPNKVVIPISSSVF